MMKQWKFENHYMVLLQIKIYPNILLLVYFELLHIHCYRDFFLVRPPTSTAHRVKSI
jgi:hypothetical protein